MYRYQHCKKKKQYKLILNLIQLFHLINAKSPYFHLENMKYNIGYNATFHICIRLELIKNKTT